MACFDDHISQAKSNLTFLIEVNSKLNANWDWQVTTCFYVAVHLMNGHLAKTANLHYRTHNDVKNGINPHNPTAIYKVPEDVYLAYSKLEGLSRRARYLCHEEATAGTEGQVHVTHDKHFAKAIKNLDKILVYFRDQYQIDFGTPVVSCLDLNANSPISIFKLK